MVLIVFFSLPPCYTLFVIHNGAHGSPFQLSGKDKIKIDTAVTALNPAASFWGSILTRTILPSTHPPDGTFAPQSFIVKIPVSLRP
jgi:hypothetical protein